MGRPLPIGTEVPPYGEVVAIGTGWLPGGYHPKPGDKGERYYLLVNDHGDRAYMPADMIESMATTEDR